MPSVDQVLLQHRQRLCDEFLANVHQSGPHYAAAGKEQLRPGVDSTVDRLVRTVLEDNMEIMREACIALAISRGVEGFTVEELQTAATILRTIVHRLLEEVYQDDLAGQLTAFKTVEEVFHVARLALAQGFVQYEKRQHVELEDVMAELSAPIVPVHHGILVMPLIGSIDSRRAALILETLLDNITRLKAEVVILDITGVPVVDTRVASYLIQATQAVRLLGSEIILTGISPTIAQTIVQLGIGFGAMTRADLAAGLEYALAQLGLAIQKVDQSS